MRLQIINRLRLPWSKGHWNLQFWKRVLGYNGANGQIKVSCTAMFLGLSFFVSMAQERKSAGVVISGEPLAESLVNQWIKDYKGEGKQAIVFEARAKKSDVSIEFLDSQKSNTKGTAYFSVAKVAILPVAVSHSGIAVELGKKGLTEETLKSLFFEDFFPASGNSAIDGIPHEIYTRLGDKGVPVLFSRFFGFDPLNIKGKAIGGNDLHVLRAMGNDANAVSFNALNLLYDNVGRKPIKGFEILPVDLDGNGKVSKEEAFYTDLDQVLQRLQEIDPKDLKNIPVGQLQIAINLETAGSEALSFLKWVLENGQLSLSKYGFLSPEAKVLEKQRNTIDDLVLNHR